MHYSLWRSRGTGWERVRYRPKEPPPTNGDGIWRLGLREKVSGLFPDTGRPSDEDVRRTLDRVIDAGLAKATERLAAERKIPLIDAVRAVLKKRAEDGYPMRGIECWFSDRGRPLDLSSDKLRTVPRGNHPAQVRTDGNHCMEVREAAGEWSWRVLPLFDVASRAAETDGALIARLHAGDLLEITRDGKREHWRVRSFVASGILRLWPAALAATQEKVVLAAHGVPDRNGRNVTSASSLRRLNPRFLRTDSLGRTFTASP